MQSCFRGIRKILGSTFRVVILPILVRYKKKIRAISGLSRRFSSRTDVFLKSQLFSKSTLNLARFDKAPSTANLSRFEKFCFRPHGREVWEVRFKKLSFVSCAFIVRVAEAPADHELPWM